MITTIKSLLIITIVSLSTFSIAQDKKANKAKIKELETQYGCFSSHKAIYKNEKWSMIKFHVVYKITTATVAKAMDKIDGVGKVKSSSGSYGILSGVTEDDLQKITDQVAETFIKRMKEEAGIEVIPWSVFERSEKTQKLKEAAEDPEIYSKSQGLGYCVSYQNTPIWNKVIAIPPGGKKLAKEQGTNIASLVLYIDFADVASNATAYINETSRSASTITYSYGESAEQSIVAGVRIVPSIGSESSWEAATNVGGTMLSVNTEYLNSWYMGYYGANPNRLTSTVPYADKVEKFEGELPEVLQNRRNKKIEYVSTFEVKTTPEKYGAAVLDAANKYFTDIIAYYNLTKN
ncbi:MAG: hypothetical protein CL840_17385 [Crocinitomicaceae bacterium]|nr:hypothetical protein [Crocinitomicaceae bacterium]|tara:strand:+ start:20852 stop:21895 length:1044 start_codon:yes stop_codon:yes gene_type:complete